MLRLFTGLSLPQDLHRRLALLQGGIPGARWTAPDNFHITLTFIGSADENLAADIDEVLADIRALAFDLALAGMGSFAQGDDPKILWAGVADNPALATLRHRIDRALETAQIPFEKRKYTPHVTLARFRHPDEDRLAVFMTSHAAFAAPPFAVTAFHLYQSHQTKNGSVYEILRSYPLNHV